MFPFAISDSAGPESVFRGVSSLTVGTGAWKEGGHGCVGQDPALNVENLALGPFGGSQR